MKFVAQRKNNYVDTQQLITNKKKYCIHNKTKSYCSGIALTRLMRLRVTPFNLCQANQ